MSGLSSEDMAVAERIGASLFPEEKKAPPPAAEPVQSAPESDAEPVADDNVDDGADYSDTSSETEFDTPVVDAAEAEASPPVKPPRGLSADELNVFNGLPPEAQKAWARRDQDREREFNRMQRRLQEQDRARETELQSIQQERQKLAQAASQFADPREQQFLKEFGDYLTDPMKVQQLALNDPAAYLRFDSELKSLQMAKAAQQQIIQQQEQEHQQNLTKFRQDQNEILRKNLRLDNDDAFNKFDADISTFLTKEGFSQQQIIAASARELQMAYDAMRWRNAQAARKTAEANKGKPAPQVVKPGSRQDVDASAERQKALRSNLRKSGSIEDAAAAIRSIL